MDPKRAGVFPIPSPSPSSAGSIPLTPNRFAPQKEYHPKHSLTRGKRMIQFFSLNAKAHLCSFHKRQPPPFLWLHAAKRVGKNHGATWDPLPTSVRSVHEEKGRGCVDPNCAGVFSFSSPSCVLVNPTPNRFVPWKAHMALFFFDKRKKGG